MLISLKTQTIFVTLARFICSLLHLSDAEFFPGMVRKSGESLLFRFKRSVNSGFAHQSGECFELTVRRGTSDLATMLQIFVNEMFSLQQLTRLEDLRSFYLEIDAMGNAPLIVDLGANAGYASRYFSESFPAAKIIAVEPMPSNAELARINNPDTERVIVLEKAVSCTNGTVALVNETGRMDSFMTTKITSDSSSPPTNCVTVNELLKANFSGRLGVPFIAKIDIEGFEDDLFQKNIEWVDQFPLLIVELHDWMLPQKRSAANFLKAIAPLDRDFVFYGEHVFSIANNMSRLLPQSINSRT